LCDQSRGKLFKTDWELTDIEIVDNNAEIISGFRSLMSGVLSGGFRLPLNNTLTVLSSEALAKYDMQI